MAIAASAERSQNQRQFETGFGSALDPASAMLELVRIAGPARMLRRTPAPGEALPAWVIDGAADGPFTDAAWAGGPDRRGGAEDSVPRALCASLLGRGATQGSGFAANPHAERRLSTRKRALPFGPGTAGTRQ
jgi:hypothetical protein